MLQLGSLKMSVSFISEECVAKTRQAADENLEVLKVEIETRCLYKGVPPPAKKNKKEKNVWAEE